MVVEVSVEYCEGCGYLKKFEELSQEIKSKNPSVKINGKEGREASFEVSVNDKLIHSRLSTLAFPDYADVSDIVLGAVNGQQLRLAKQQPINDCNIM